MVIHHQAIIFKLFQAEDRLLIKRVIIKIDKKQEIT